MTNIGHFRAAGKLLDQHRPAADPSEVAPPTKMDAAQLTEEGYYSVFGKSGARIEIPGCSLCMGNQARVADGATVVSTSTRNFPEPFGHRCQRHLASAELAAVASCWVACRRRTSTRPIWRRSTDGGGYLPLPEL